jgi:hypothetical protein
MARKALREGASIVSPETILKVHVSGLAQAGVATGSGAVVSFDRGMVCAAESGATVAAALAFRKAALEMYRGIQECSAVGWRRSKDRHVPVLQRICFRP